MSVHAFPVRLAETVNRFGTARVERSAIASPRRGSALVTLGERTFVARVHGERVTRRGRQTLVSVHGRRTWIASQRVQSLDAGEGLTA
jgi:hypothetical protein